MNDTAEASVQNGTSSSDVLSITLNGPFLYVFHPGHVNRTVDIYAPFCPYHEAGIFYSRNSVSETDLWKCALSKSALANCDRTYAIRGGGILENIDKPTIVGPANQTEAKDLVIELIGVGDNTVFAPRFDKMMFSLSVPRPKWIYPLYYDYVEVVQDYKTAAKGAYQYYCTGLRFFYEWDSESRISLQIPSTDTVDITPPIFDKGPELSSADIEVRYAGLNVADENDPHSDARSCFASLTTLGGVEHWLNYGDGRGSPTNPCPTPSTDPTNPPPGPCACLGHVPRLHTGADCYAPILVLGLD